MDIPERPENADLTCHLTGPETTFINMLRYGIMAAQLLPENSTAGIIVLTDGYLGLSDTPLFESMMTQLRNNTTACSFIKVGGPYCSNSGFGRVACTELMQFIATDTFGAYPERLSV